MSTKDEIRNSVESDMIAEALDAYMDSEGTKIIRDNAACAGRFPLSGRVDRKLRRAIQRELAAQSFRSRRVRRSVIAVAAIMAAALCGTAYAYREEIYNFVVTQQEKYLSAGGEGHAYISMSGLYSPSYLPEGYEPHGNPVQHRGMTLLTYQERDTGDFITFQQSESGAGRMLDTERAVSVENLCIGDMPGKLVTLDNGFKQLMWDNGNFLISAARADNGELISMAESVVWIPDGDNRNK